MGCGRDFIGKFGVILKRGMKILCVAALMAATAAITFAVTYTELSRGSVNAKMGEVSWLLQNYFIDEYDEATLETAAADGAAQGMVAATGDQWSYYISAEEYSSYAERMSNSYVGIGVTIRENEMKEGFDILTVSPGGPADEAGIQVGDLLLQVDGKLVWELGRDATVDLVRGKAGTELTLKLSREGKPYSVTLARGSVTTEVATYRLTEDKKAIITIKNFDEHCADQTIQAIEQALSDGAVGIVFDLRNNPGGMKNELVKVLDRLLPEGDLFRSLDYAGREEVDTSDAVRVELPMAVLVNEESYSAAEFFAAAMQEYDAAIIVGAQTTGKGNFQSTFNLSDGSAVNISIGKYFTPKGKSLTDTGVAPDLSVDMGDEEFYLLYYGALEPEKDIQLQAALKALS